MTMPRLFAWTLLVAIGFALHGHPASAQDQPLPAKRFDGGALNEYLVARGIAASELPVARKQFQAFATYYAEMVAHPLVHKAAQDPSTKDPTGRIVPPFDGPNGFLQDMQRFILEPSANLRVTVDRADFIREMGAAFDAALKPLIESHPEKIVRVNAARMLAVACKSGATAHYPTVTELLNNANTPTEIKHYLLMAAGNLLSAYDVYDIKSRRHSNGWNDTPKGAGEKELAALVLAVENHVVNPAAIMSNLKDFKADGATPDQNDVIRFVRRQAIKALGQVRFVAIAGLGGKTLYPAFTLARVCVSDPTLGPAPSPSECAEAAIGICNMSPWFNGNVRKDYDADAAAEAVTAALVTFAGPRAANPSDKSLPWRGYGLRLTDAVRRWGGMFDFAYDPSKPDVFNQASVPASVAVVNQQAQIALFTPLEKLGVDGKPDLVGGSVKIEDLKLFLKQQRDRANRRPLFTTVPGTELYLPVKK